MSTSSNGSGSSPGKRRKRVSLAMTSHLAQFVDGGDRSGDWDRQLDLDRDGYRDRDWDRDRDGHGEPMRAKTSLAFVSPGDRESEIDALAHPRRAGSLSGSGSGGGGGGSGKKRGALPTEFRHGAEERVSVECLFRLFFLALSSILVFYWIPFPS